MDIEKLYQDVWARVFAELWAHGVASGQNMSYQPNSNGVALDASAAAQRAVELWDPAKAQAVIAEKAAKS